MPRPTTLFTLLFTLLFTAACTTDVTPDPQPDPPAERVAFVGISADVGSLNQHYARSALDAMVSEPLSLFLVNNDFVDGRLVQQPALAKSWTLAPDGRSLELTLRDDNTWHDGAPVRAQDLVFTFGLLFDEQTGSRLARATALLEPGGVEANDDHSLRFSFVHPVELEEALGQLGGVVPLPQHLLADVPADELRAQPFNRAPVLNGCWTLEAWVPGTQLDLVARPWGVGAGACAPQIDRVVFRVLPEYATRLLELREGRLDILADVRVQDAAELGREHPEIAFHRRGPRSLVYVGWNQRDVDGAGPHPLLGQPGVRRALAQAVDVDAIMADLFHDPVSGETYARRAVGTITPALAGLSTAGIAPLDYDPAAARAALEALGWADSDGDGVLDRDGEPFRIDVLTIASAASRAQVGVYLQADLAKIGVAVDITSLERTAWMARADAGDFDALLGGWSASLYVDPSSTWHSGPDARWNWIGYANPAVDTLIEQGLAAESPERAMEIWSQLQAEIYQDQPYLFLYWADEIVAVNQRLQGVKVDIQAPWHGLEGWSVVE